VIAMSYAERKARLSKLELSKWANRPRTDDKKGTITQQHRDLWDALNQYVTERGGAITSVRYASPIRLEFDPESPLADKLKELGYSLTFLERDGRWGGPATPDHDARWRNRAVTSGYGFRTVDVYELRLPK
jgi:hypothetical protein